MNLSSYLTKTVQSPETFAEKIGVHRTSVVRFCNGTRRPDLETLEKIHNATGGQVTAVDFFENPPVVPAPDQIEANTPEDRAAE